MNTGRPFRVAHLIFFIALLTAARTHAQCTSPPTLYELGGSSMAVCNAIFNHQALGRGRSIHIVQTNISPPVVRGTLTVGGIVRHMHTEIVSRIWATDGESVYGLNTDNPASPVLMGQLMLPVGPDLVKRVRVRGSYLYALSSTRLHIVDITNPGAPVLRSSMPVNGASELYDLEVVGSYAYLCGVTTAPYCSLIVVNIANPTQPSEVNRVGTAYNYRIALRHSSGALYSIGPNGQTNGGMAIWSLSNPATPSLLAVNTTVEVNYLDDLVVGSTAVLHLRRMWDGFRVEIRNTSTLALQGTSAALPWALGIAFDPPRVLVAENYGGMDIINIATPTAPVTTHRALDLPPGAAFQVAGDGGGYTVLTGAWNGAWFFDTTQAGPPRTISHIPVPDPTQLYDQIAIVADVAFLVRRIQGLSTSSVIEAWQIVPGANPTATFRGSYPVNTWIDGFEAGVDGSNVRRVYFTTGSTLRILNATNLAAMSQTGTFALTPGASNRIKFVQAGVFPPAATRLLVSSDFSNVTQIVNITSAVSPSSLGVIPAGGDAIGFSLSHAWLLDEDTLRSYDISTPATPVFRGATKVCPPGDRGVAFKFIDPFTNSAMVLTEQGRLVRVATSNQAFPGILQIAYTNIAGRGLTFDGAALHAAASTGGYRVFNLAFTASPAENPNAPLTSRTLCPSGPTVLNAAFVASPAVSSYQWFKGDPPALLANGPTGTGSTISGATTPSLTISGATPADVGAYFCRAANACGANDSGTAILSVCYANCDCSTTSPWLNVGDFTCFLQKYAAGDAYANCDGSTVAPVLNVGDFTCYLQTYGAGCP